MKTLISVFFLSWGCILMPVYQTTYVRAFTTDDYISQYSFQYKVPAKLLINVLNRESKVKCDPPSGDHGLANGIAQFHKSTFDLFAKEKGEQLDYDSCQDQIKLMAWAFSKGEKYRWNWSSYRAIVRS